MRPRRFSPVLAGWILASLLLPMAALGQEATLHEESVERELVALYRSFEGDPEDQTWEKWQDYFLRSPNIGNMHGTSLEIGWERYREGSIPYYQRPPQRRAEIRFEELEVFVIDERTAWVKGVFVNILGERELRPLFHDMLIKTADGWRVFFSYVAPPN